MQALGQAVSPGLVGLLVAVAGVMLLVAVRATDWRALASGGGLNRLFGCAVVIALVWSARAEPVPGLTFRLIGIPLAALMLGPAAAIVCAALAIVAKGLWLADSWIGDVAEFVLYGALPALLTDIGRRAVAQWLPAHLFVYILGAGFAVCGVVAALCQLGAGSLVAALGLATWSSFGLYAPYLILIGFAEATLSGMLITLMVVYLPDWVATFRDSHYFERR
jgi:uncharacterized membrane protein